jgi:hypothetical protein
MAEATKKTVPKRRGSNEKPLETKDRLMDLIGADGKDAAR